MISAEQIVLALVGAAGSGLCGAAALLVIFRVFDQLGQRVERHVLAGENVLRIVAQRADIGEVGVFDGRMTDQVGGDHRGAQAGQRVAVLGRSLHAPPGHGAGRIDKILDHDVVPVQLVLDGDGHVAKERVAARTWAGVVDDVNILFRPVVVFAGGEGHTACDEQRGDRHNFC